jgi:hypothetical protein
MRGQRGRRWQGANALWNRRASGRWRRNWWCRRRGRSVDRFKRGSDRRTWRRRRWTRCSGSRALSMKLSQRGWRITLGQRRLLWLSRCIGCVRPCCRVMRAIMRWIRGHGRSLGTKRRQGRSMRGVWVRGRCSDSWMCGPCYRRNAWGWRYTARQRTGGVRARVRAWATYRGHTRSNERRRACRPRERCTGCYS